MHILGTAHTAPGFALPPGACDCHVHVFGPPQRFPFHPGRKYTPGPASIEDLQALHRVLHIDRVVVVHPSPYGADNACTLDALVRMGPRARGVAVVDAATTDAALAAMHAAGMRGARVNLETEGARDPALARAAIREAAARCAPRGWHVQVYTHLAVIDALHDTLMALPVPLVIDHFGRPEAARGVSQAGFPALLSLVGAGRAYVKLSAPYRISALPGYADAAPIARALIAANPERMLWGSDWPHPGGQSGPRRPEVIEPFRPEDDGAALARLASWVDDAAQLHCILVENPARLYGF